MAGIEALRLYMQRSVSRGTFYAGNERRAGEVVVVGGQDELAGATSSIDGAYLVLPLTPNYLTRFSIFHHSFFAVCEHAFHVDLRREDGLLSARSPPACMRCAGAPSRGPTLTGPTSGV